ncbi:hypothetical protein FTO74_02365 [Granulicella sp. WH15]|uniref:hypothetical protein n=1 Tax=Granulicella sp. WH15 TaxID=2602070 RepID=UPI0013671510|nr:hypothetical protein [Granulicella sp. WH15]QHN02342.1 hypothetical protein FTO74_02365 [Granulicella sp. WH15]
MRRFVTLAILLLFTLPFGASIAGCGKKTAVTFCNGSAGLVVGQLTLLTLQPRLTGISLNQGEIGQISTPTGADCKGSNVSVSSFTYGTQNQALVDVQPTTGRLCAGTWNRNTGGAIPDYTTCIPNNLTGTTYVTATADGVTSNPLAVYVHPIVTSIILGLPSTNCVTDPASNCALDPTQTNGCSTAAVSSSGFPNYNETSCVSQGAIVQLAARVYKGSNTGLSSNNISCLVGPLTFSAQSTTTGSTVTASNIVTINQVGQATAGQPGSVVINASTSDSSSSAGFFSTCPPKTITLAYPGATGSSINVNQNNPQQVVSTVVDTNNNPMTNVSLEYVSTAPTIIPIAGAVATPAFPGAAAVTALCQPPACNTAPFNQIGLFGNGLPVTSNPLTINTPGTSSSVLYVGSTDSQYILPVDFTNQNAGTPVRLPFAPNSMVLSQDLTTLYMGSTTELMVMNAATTALTSENNTVSGSVLAVSPNNAVVVISDPVRKLTYLYNSSGSVATQYGAVGIKAEWTPDSNTVYIVTNDNHLLTYSTYTGWNLTDLTGTTTAVSDLAITVPNSGVFLAGAPETARTVCPNSTPGSGTGVAQTVTNVFYPLADTTSVTSNGVAATNDGQHILSANTTQFADIKVSVPRGACPTSGTPTFAPQTVVTPALAGVTADSITGVVATSDSAYGFVTYTGTGGVIPQYDPATSTLSNITLSGTATAPVAAVISTDNQLVFVGTSGDNLIHILTRGTSGFADSTSTTGIPIPLAPLLPSITGSGFATPNLLAQRPRKLTS